MSAERAGDRRGLRRLALTLLVMAEIAVILIFASNVVLRNDFMEYWAAARLTLEGRDPYDPAAMSAVQAAAGWTRTPVMMWNPPWAIPFVLPFALIPYRVASLLWPLFLLSVVAISAFVGWRSLAGAGRPVEPAIALSLLFPPSWFAAMGGQISPLLLFGLTGFLWAVTRRRDACAGGFLFLLLIKPHLLLLVLFAVVFWSVRERRWGVLVGVASAAGVFGLIPILSNPAIWAQYVDRVTGTAPEQFVTMTLGAALRVIWGWDRFWLQFVPAALGTAWLAGYLWARRAAPWSWIHELPLLILVSLLTTAYAWVHDVVVAVPVLLACMASLATLRSSRLGRTLGLLFAAASFSMVVSKFRGDAALADLWIVPALFVAFVLTRLAEERAPLRTGRPVGQS